MKLKNRKTGEIKECAILPIDENGYPNEYQVFEKGESLSELNEEWEDYEEPKEYYYIEADGSILKNIKPRYINQLLGGLKSIGNYFETQEEAEKVVEKIKAWNRLKDKGFHWLWYNSTPTGNSVEFYINEWDEEATRDITLLFGGEI